MGIQLRPYNTGNVFDVLNLIQNLSITLFMAYMSLFYDLYEFEKRYQFFNQMKPLFGLFFQFTLRLIFPISELINNMYYIKNGFLIIQLLDSNLSNPTFCNGNNRSIWAILFYNISLFLILNLNLNSFLYLFNTKERIQFLFRFYDTFIRDSTRSFVLVAIHYLQNSILNNLKDIHTRLKTNDQKFGSFIVVICFLY